MQSNKVVLFADDAVTLFGNPIDGNPLTLNVHSSEKWSQYHHLTVNESKTEQLLFCKKISGVKIAINFHTKDTVKYFGVVIDNRLNFSAHIQENFRALP